MSSRVELDVSYKIGNAPVQVFPYPHIYVRDIFPADFYAELLRNLPPSGDLKPIAQLRSVSAYPDRFILPLAEEHLAALREPYRAFWTALAGWLIGQRFATLVLNKFAPVVGPRLQDPAVEFYDEALLVEDRTRYSLGPHTDKVTKLVSMLFYLPKDASLQKHGTSIYVPKDLSFTCPGGPHYPFDRFERLATMPFLPNSMFAFAKTANSFHGVEPIMDAEVRRHLLLYDIQIKVRDTAPAPAKPQGPAVKFGF